MIFSGEWLKRFAKILGIGILFAIVVTEIELAAGFDLLDAPFFHAPLQAIVLGVAALAFAIYQARPSTATRGLAAGVLLFGIVVLPFNALVERQPIPVEFWKGTSGLLLDRTMTVGRPHSVILIIKGSQPVSGPTAGGQADARGVLGADTIVARLFGDPRSSFTVVPDGNQPKAVNLTDDMRWAWTATPRQEGPQKLVLELDTIVKSRGAADRASNLYRQLVRITVQGPSWYEAIRNWLIGLVWA
jgi:hypothetical protein